MKKTSIYDPIDLCACYEPIFEPPAYLVALWSNIMTDSTEYFNFGKTRIKIREHFSPKGKPLGSLLENVIKFSGNSSL